MLCDEFTLFATAKLVVAFCAQTVIRAAQPAIVHACLQNGQSSYQESFLGRVGPFVVDFIDRSHQSNAYTCYEGIVRGLDAGNYTASVIHDYSDGEWNPRWNPQGGGPFGSAYVVTPPNSDATSSVNSIEVVGETPIPTVPCTSDFYGRWVEGIFTPMFCTLNAGPLDECMTKLGKGVYLYGDSNSRRTMKTIYSRGKWCSDPEEVVKVYCECEDCKYCMQEQHNEKYLKVEFEEFARVVYSDQAFVQFVEWTGESLRVEGPIAVLAGMGAWPLASKDIHTFGSELRQFLQSLSRENTYIFRTAPYFCCASSTHHRRYTSKRATVFQRLFKEIVLTEFPNALIWDTTQISESLSIEEIGKQSSRCYSNHMNGTLVNEDAKILTHLLCCINTPGPARCGARG